MTRLEGISEVYISLASEPFGRWLTGRNRLVHIDTNVPKASSSCTTLSYHTFTSLMQIPFWGIGYALLSICAVSVKPISLAWWREKAQFLQTTKVSCVYLPAIDIDIRVGVARCVRRKEAAEVQPRRNLTDARSTVVAIKTGTHVVPSKIEIISWHDLHTGVNQLNVLGSVKRRAIDRDGVGRTRLLEPPAGCLIAGWP
ncbi:hypothetical protein HZ326_28778 [Fusarium oxysporum f. sp. albedinis]|nr:hypothetical protein HZ326_28778 [Fusarium oxysporum f. sp. albedinis]